MKTTIDAEREAICKAWLDHGFRLDPIPPTRAPTRPSKTLMQGFEYTPARATNVAETWRKHGWKAPLRKAP